MRSYFILFYSILFYSALFCSIFSGETPAVATYYGNPTNRKPFFNFATTSYGSPSLLSFRMYTKFDRHIINSESYTLYHGACVDSFSSEKFETLKEKPFGLLTESYYTCTQFSSDAFINAAGKCLRNSFNYFWQVIIFFSVLSCRCCEWFDWLVLAYFHLFGYDFYNVTLCHGWKEIRYRRSWKIVWGTFCKLKGMSQLNSLFFCSQCSFISNLLLL